MSADLFGEAEPHSAPPPDPLAQAPEDAPLAERLRPRAVEEVSGQEHLLAEGKLLARMLDEGVSQSLILWGPPGCGKTTLARLLAAKSELRFVPFSAVLSGIKQIKLVMVEARREREVSGKPTLLFVDEIHRFNKAQQDAFLPYVECGDIVLVGATTENPSFEVVGPLLSRGRVIVLEPLPVDALVALLRRAVGDERGLDGAIQINDACLTTIAHASDGDARRALTMLETAATLAPESGLVDADVLREALQRKVLAHDKSGEAHYDLISALHKSVRNSDADATLYWTARLLEAGEDRAFVVRRLIRMAVEDIGLADPAALRVALDGADAWHRLGSPEGELALAQVACYLARAPKSNAIYAGYAAAVEDVQQTAAEPVPLHLRNASTALMKGLGYGRGYRYAHDDPEAVAEMECLPPGLVGKRYLDLPDPHRDDE